ncbi:MAG: hypothetical protein ACKVUT_18000 [Gaiella sp.]
MKRYLIPLAAVIAAALAVTAGASVTVTGWTRVSDGGAEGSVGLARVTDRTLHVVWARAGTAFDSRISAGGKPAGRTPVASGWASMAGPALVVQPDGTLRAFLSGSIKPGDVGADIGIHTATAPPSGAAWTLDPQAVWGGALANQRDVHAVLGKDGTPVTAVGGSGAVFFNGIARGADGLVLPPAPYSYDPEVAVDQSSGAVVASWYVDQGGQRGIVTQQVYPSAGPRRLVGAADEAVDGGVSGRIGAAGTYVVISSPAGVRFGRVGGALGLVGKDAAVKAVDVTTGPDGRLWVSWLSTDGKLHAVRTNRAASRFGAIQVATPPTGSPTAFELAGEGSAGPLDAIARYSSGSVVAWWHRQLLPPLSLSVRRDRKNVASIAVTDVGDPVAGAKVTLAGRSATTDAKGRARVPGVTKAGKATAVAGGYADATVKFG